MANAVNADTVVPKDIITSAVFIKLIIMVGEQGLEP